MDGSFLLKITLVECHSEPVVQQCSTACTLAIKMLLQAALILLSGSKCAVKQGRSSPFGSLVAQSDVSCFPVIARCVGDWQTR